jgi:hypothetical protein
MPHIFPHCSGLTRHPYPQQVCIFTCVLFSANPHFVVFEIEESWRCCKCMRVQATISPVISKSKFLSPVISKSKFLSHCLVFPLHKALLFCSSWWFNVFRHSIILYWYLCFLQAIPVGAKCSGEESRSQRSFSKSCASGLTAGCYGTFEWQNDEQIHQPFPVS